MHKEDDLILPSLFQCFAVVPNLLQCFAKAGGDILSEDLLMRRSKFSVEHRAERILFFVRTALSKTLFSF